LEVQYLRREGDRDWFATFYPVYALRSSTAGRDEDDSHILYILLVPSHPFRLVADLVNFDFEQGGDWDR
jgi:hypothetical protein